ncbi:olfactory receptor 2M2-like [Tamandua tetradactyla]|uniref:olfactory receptor 2M2-like n=1 Tax=Tamandua tetradactyla TaxID=48850 RepID=UPI0040540370
MSRKNETLTDFFLLGIFPELLYISIFIIFIIVVYIITFTGNAILILLIWVDSHLHTPMYILLSHLSLIDLALISTTVPKMVINFFSGNRNISKVGCGTQIFFFFALGGGECILLTLMSFDRYVAICNPLRYPVIMNPRVCLQMALVSWGGGALNSLINTIYTMHFPFCGSREIHHFFCEMPAILKLSCEDTSLYEMVVSVICIVFILIPLGLIMTSYMLIFLTVLRMNSPEGRKKALATCSSHLAVVSFYYVPAMIIYMTPHSFHSLEQDQILSIINTIFIPRLTPSFTV